MYGPSNISGAACCEHRPRGDRLSWHQAGRNGNGSAVAAPNKRRPVALETQTGRLTARRQTPHG